jgi:geranylgeranyl pyrophosphate synthase
MASAMSNDAQAQIDPFAALQNLLKERLLLLAVALHPLLRIDVMRALEADGKLFSPAHPEGDFSLPAGMWPLLTLLVGQHIAPEIDLTYASSVSVAVECFVCAIDLLDDVIDGDQTPTVQALGIARVLNVSTALLTLGQQAILSLSRHGASPAYILRLLDTFQEAAMITAVGQHRDILAEQRSAQDFTREECIEIAKAKAGSIMRLACRLGALCAGADEGVCERFSELGELLGIAHQLDNDCHDLYYLLPGHISTIEPVRDEAASRSMKTDLLRGKKTLPVVLAARIDGTIQEISSLADEEKQEYLQALSEGIITTWGICLLYRERARDCLQEIEAQGPVAPALRLLLGLE